MTAYFICEYMRAALIFKILCFFVQLNPLELKQWWKHYVFEVVRLCDNVRIGR